MYVRDIGQGHPIAILHGGPDFDHTYLLPELDVLARSFRLIYYDQRGRGRSAAGVAAEDVTIQSELEDLDRLRSHLGMETMAVLGHSWGGLLAMEYALRYTLRVSHLLLLNTAPHSLEGRRWLREHFRARRTPAEIERMEALAASETYQRGDATTEAEYYRIHFRIGLHRPELVDPVVNRLRTHFTPETILLARAIELNLCEQAWRRSDLDLLPQWAKLTIPTLIIHGDQELVPIAVAEQIAATVPQAQLEVLESCGHFSYLECPDQVERLVRTFLGSDG